MQFSTPWFLVSIKTRTCTFASTTTAVLQNMESILMWQTGTNLLHSSQSNPQDLHQFGKVEVRMLKGGNLVANTSAQPDVSIFIRKSPTEQILKRYVTIFNTWALNLGTDAVICVYTIYIIYNYSTNTVLE